MKYAKTDSRYWSDAIYHLEHRINGKVRFAKKWSVKIQHAKRREIFDLGTANKQDASAKARDIFLSLKSHGWDQTLETYKASSTPKPETPAPLPEAPDDTIRTVGEYLEAASKISTTTARTFADYCRSFRLIVAAIHKIKVRTKKYDHKNGGRDRWIKKIHAVPLDQITPAKVTRWKTDFLNKRKKDPQDLKRAKNSVSSYIRQSKSLFSSRILPHLPVPSDFVSPFTDVTLEKRQSTRYRGESVSITDLISAAHKGDKKRSIEPLSQDGWKIFILALGVGLRRKEIDLLEYFTFNFKKNLIDIQVTKYFQPKSEESLGEVQVDKEIMALFKTYKKEVTGSFVIESKVEPKINADYATYRCQKHFDEVIKWLRDRGFKSQKPIHTLRKEYGSMLCEKFGIYAASRGLRHAGVAITAQHYLENKTRKTVGVGAKI